MTIVRLENRHFFGGIWIDARLSDTTLPFMDSILAPGFPRKIDYRDSVEIDLANWCEIRYRRELDPVKDEQTIVFAPDIYRIVELEKDAVVNVEIVDNA